MKRKLEIYEKYHQGIKTGILVKTYNISRQRIHQILKEVELYQLKNAETISQKKEEIQKIKNEKLCGSCYFYDSNGFCDNAKSLDSCADRDRDRTCDNGQYKYDENKGKN